jgi:hypothetical protein
MYCAKDVYDSTYVNTNLNWQKEKQEYAKEKEILRFSLDKSKGSQMW